MNDKKFSVANIITVFGLLTIAPLVYFLIKDSGLGVLISISLVILTDLIDGTIARKLKQITTFGKIMDPVRDRLLLLVILLYFIAITESLIVVWLVVLTIIIEAISSITKTIIYKKYSIIDHTLVGQARMFVHSVVIIYLIINQYWLKLTWPSIEEGLLIIFFATFFAFLSHFEQLRKISK